MDDIKQAQLKNLRVWCRRFNLEINEAQADSSIDAASQYPGLSGSVRRLPLALIFSKKIIDCYPKTNTGTKQFLASVFATVMVSKVYDGNVTPWGVAVRAELNRLCGSKAEMTKETFQLIDSLTAAAEGWYREASAVRDKEYQTLGGMLKRALRDLE